MKETEPMNAQDEKGTAKRNLARAIASLMLAALFTSCAVYRVKDMDAKTLAAKGRKSRIIGVTTKTGYVEFRKKDPAGVKGNGVVGNVYGAYDIHLYDIADMTPAGKRAKVVLKGGDRFQVLSSWRIGDTLKCDVVKPTWIPLDEVVSASVRTVNAAASVFTTLAGAVLLVGALALDAATGDEDEGDVDDTFTGQLLSPLVDSWLEPSPRKSNKDLLAQKEPLNAAEEKEFWIMEWTPVSAEPGEDGKCRLRLENASGVPRGVDEAKLVVVDHPPGVGVAPDCRGVMRTFSAPEPPAQTADEDGQDITDLVRAKDDVFWRSPAGDPASDLKTHPRDELTFEFPKPAGACRAKLVVSATNSAWRAQFAGEVLTSSGGAATDQTARPVYQESEYNKLRVRILTVFGWETGQVIFVDGPLPAGDMIYDLDLGDVGTDSLWLKIDPPAGYWLIDRLALDYSEDVDVEAGEIEAEDVDSPDAAAILEALAVEDGSTLFLEDSGSWSVLTFTLPPPKDGMERTLFLRTVSCYETLSPLASPPRRPESPSRQTGFNRH
jgi:hypothetical protein